MFSKACATSTESRKGHSGNNLTVGFARLFLKNGCCVCLCVCVCREVLHV